MKHLQYLPKLFTALSFLLLLIVFMLLFFGRNVPVLQADWILRFSPDFYTHVSNLCISYFIYATVGYVWLMMGVKIKAIIILGIAIVLTNLLYELFVPALNYRDIVDAYYGIAGVLAGFLFLFITQQFGLKRNDLFEKGPTLK